MRTRRLLSRIFAFLLILSLVSPAPRPAEASRVASRLQDPNQTTQTSIWPDWEAHLADSYRDSSYGTALASAGDVNNDGYDDVIVGAPTYSLPTGYPLGAAFAYYGSVNGLSASPNWSRVSPTFYDDQYGIAVAPAGDVNGDHYDDVVVGAPYFDAPSRSQAGKVYLYYGSGTGLLTTLGWSYAGTLTWELLGFDLDGQCDVNGDNYSDVIIGAHGYASGQSYEGAVMVFYGSPTGLPSTPSWYFQSETVNASLGASVACAGDINHDGYDDVIAGAPGYTQNLSGQGAVFAWYGSPSGLGGSSWSIIGGSQDQGLGIAVSAAGDVDNDNYRDILVGDIANSAYSYYGSTTGLGGLPDWSITGTQPNSYFGVSLTGAGDLNVDGYDDIAVGAMRYNGDEHGAFFVYYGSNTGLAPVPGWSVTETEANSRFGSYLGNAGDVDNDGDGELLAGNRRNSAMAYYGRTEAPITGLVASSDSPTLFSETTHFTATVATGSYIAYSWDYGDGTTGIGPVASHTYTQEGDFTAVVTATNRYGSQIASTPVHIDRTCFVRLNNDPTDYGSVQQSIDASTHPDDIVKVAGTCTNINDRGGYPQVVYLDKTLTIQGGYTNTNWINSDPLLYPTVLDAQGLGRVIFATGNFTPTIAGLDITGGDGTGHGFGPPEGGSGGGGIAAESSGLILENVKIYDNTIIGAGAAIGNYHNTLTIRNSQIYSNTAYYDAVNDFVGSGGLDSFQSVLYIENSQFADNSTEGDGGALRLDEVSTTVLSTTFEANQADYNGGAVWVTHHGYFFQDCTFTGNQAGEDGGAYWAEENFTNFERNLFQDNTAEDDGGAAYLSGSADLPGNDYTLSNNAMIDNQSGELGSGLAIVIGNAILEHMTLANNTSPAGASLDIWKEEPEPSVVTMTNAIISDAAIGIRVNTDDLLTMDGVLWDATTPVTLTHVTSATVNIQNQIVGDPAFAPDGYHITATSDAIDAGSPSSVNYDIDNQPRPMRTSFDLGADEYPDTPITGLTATSSSPTLLGETTWFSATISSGSTVSYVWNFGDTGSGSGASSSHTYPASGVYTATVTATNSLGGQSREMGVIVFETMELAPGNTSTTSDGLVEISAPAGITQTLTITYTPQLTTTQAVSGFDLAGVIFHLQAVDQNGDPVTSISPPLTLILHYDEDDLPPGINEADLTLRRYDFASGDWVLLPVLEQDLAANTLTVSLDHLSEFALLAPQEKLLYLPTICR